MLSFTEVATIFGIPCLEPQPSHTVHGRTRARLNPWLKPLFVGIDKRIEPETMVSLTTIHSNVNPGLIIPWLINRRVSPFSGDSSLLEETPPNNGTGLLILGQHYVFSDMDPSKA